MNMEMMGLKLEQSESENRVQEFKQKFETLGHSPHVVVQVSNADGQWFRDSTAYYKLSNTERLVVEVPNDQGILERFQSTDENCTNFENLSTGEILKLALKFDE